MQPSTVINNHPPPWPEASHAATVVDLKDNNNNTYDNSCQIILMAVTACNNYCANQRQLATTTTTTDHHNLASRKPVVSAKQKHWLLTPIIDVCVYASASPKLLRHGIPLITPIFVNIQNRGWYVCCRNNAFRFHMYGCWLVRLYSHRLSFSSMLFFP